MNRLPARLMPLRSAAWLLPVLLVAALLWAAGTEPRHAPAPPGPALAARHLPEASGIAASDGRALLRLSLRGPAAEAPVWLLLPFGLLRRRPPSATRPGPSTRVTVLLPLPCWLRAEGILLPRPPRPCGRPPRSSCLPLPRCHAVRIALRGPPVPAPA